MDILTNEVEEQLPEGFIHLTKGYCKYAAEVAISRALPAIDGFKPANRRILYTMYKSKFKSLTKSANVVGSTLPYHPHSDASIYETMVNMADSSEYMQFPFIHGKGNFSKVYFSLKDAQPAAQRYTEVCLNENSETLFGEMDGIEYQPTEDGKLVEPTLLPVSFPNILTTSNRGVAVGIACLIPSFNFNEVLELTMEYLKEGKITRVIAPDFPTGGEYVLNNRALESIMLEGKGTIKLRGRWEIQDRDIVITQIPYYTRISDILSVARDIRGVASANDETDLKGMRIRVSCTSKSIVNRVVLELLRDTGLQCTVSSNINVVIGKDVKLLGVIGVIEKWVEFRRAVLKKQLELDLKKVCNTMRAPKALVELIENQPLKEKFLDALKTSDIEAEKILREGMPDLEEDIIEYIMGLTMRQFGNCEARKAQYRNLKNREALLRGDLADIDRVIIRQLSILNDKYKIPRRTVIVNKDYTFESLEEEDAAAKEVSNYSVAVQIKGMYIKKMRFYTGEEPVIRCFNEDIISVLDDRGRLLRIPLQSIPDCNSSSLGSFIPVVLNIKNDFSILDYRVIAKQKVRYFYKDGYASVLDLGEWVGSKRVTRVSERGVAPDHIDKLHCVLPEKGEYQYLLVITKKKSIGLFSLDFEERSRTARTKLGTIPKDDELLCVCPVRGSEAVQLLAGDTARYFDKCSPLSKDVQVNESILTELLKRKV